MEDTIRTAHLRRLAILKVRAALMGWDCPPHILIEIEDLRQECKLWLVDGIICSYGYR